MAKKSTIRISLECSYDQWWRYNVYVSAATFRDGDKVDYQSLTDTVYPLGNGSEVRLCPEGYNPQRPLTLEVEAAESLELFVYIIPNTMPVADSIAQSPPFSVRLKVKGAELSSREELLVNQWGGVSIHKTY
ncbi:MAG: hypothetical protein J6K81_02040 [Rikenellaceae bacterium]|nr:hypothetical protein [Rikenellaceae bacterium]